MTDLRRFICPQCGNDIVVGLTESRTIGKDFFIIHDCGYRFTEDDIKRQLIKVSDKMMRDAFRKL